MQTTHTCLPHIADSHQPSGLLGYANLISMPRNGFWLSNFFSVHLKFCALLLRVMTGQTRSVREPLLARLWRLWRKGQMSYKMREMFTLDGFFLSTAGVSFLFHLAMWKKNSFCLRTGPYAIFRSRWRMCPFLGRDILEPGHYQGLSHFSPPHNRDVFKPVICLSASM